MKNGLIVLLLVTALASFGQTKDSLIVSEELVEDSLLICSFREEGAPPGPNFTKEDSATHCRYTKIYKTNFSDIFYQKEYNLSAILVAEGPVTTTLGKRKFLKRKNLFYFKNGLWKEYDYLKKEILYIEYSQGYSNIDSWNIQIGKKVEKMK